MIVCVAKQQKRQNTRELCCHGNKILNLNQELNISEGWFVYAVLFKHYKAYILCLLLKWCKFEYGWGKL